jgi:hypothetical protein
MPKDLSDMKAVWEQVRRSESKMYLWECGIQWIAIVNRLNVALGWRKA